MPRISAEGRSAALFSINAKPPEPPADLTKEGRDLWRRTVRERPGDWFSPVSQKLLHILVKQIGICGELERLYDVQIEREHQDGAGIVLKRLLAVSANCASIAARLRLVPQAQIDRRSGRITETGTGGTEDEDRLLGGQAAWGTAPTRTSEEPASTVT
jgi:hypothetical protein